MDIKEFAHKLNGRMYGNEITVEEETFARELGYVVVFGYSDDNTEFRGAIDDEVGSYNGGIIRISSIGVLEECECNCKSYIEALKHSKRIYVIWDSDGYSLVYKTQIPHETFEIFDNGDKYCKGIIFKLTDI